MALNHLKINFSEGEQKAWTFHSAAVGIAVWNFSPVGRMQMLYLCNTSHVSTWNGPVTKGWLGSLEGDTGTLEKFVAP